MSNQVEEKAQEVVKKFVKDWQTADSRQDAIKKFEGGAKRACQLAYYLRSKGVPLKKFRYTAKYDIPTLIKIANKYLENGRVQKVKTLDTKSK